MPSSSSSSSQKRERETADGVGTGDEKPLKARRLNDSNERNGGIEETKIKSAEEMQKLRKDLEHWQQKQQVFEGVADVGTGDSEKRPVKMAIRCVRKNENEILLIVGLQGRGFGQTVFSAEGTKGEGLYQGAFIEGLYHCKAVAPLGVVPQSDTESRNSRLAVCDLSLTLEGGRIRCSPNNLSVPQAFRFWKSSIERKDWEIRKSKTGQPIKLLTFDCAIKTAGLEERYELADMRRYFAELQSQEEKISGAALKLKETAQKELSAVRLSTSSLQSSKQSSSKSSKDTNPSENGDDEFQSNDSVQILEQFLLEVGAWEERELSDQAKASDISVSGNFGEHLDDDSDELKEGNLLFQKPKRKQADIGDVGGGKRKVPLEKSETPNVYRICIIGATGAGKSSVTNALLGEKIALSDSAGKAVTSFPTEFFYHDAKKEGLVETCILKNAPKCFGDAVERAVFGDQTLQTVGRYRVEIEFWAKEEFRTLLSELFERKDVDWATLELVYGRARTESWKSRVHSCSAKNKTGKLSQEEEIEKRREETVEKIMREASALVLGGQHLLGEDKIFLEDKVFFLVLGEASEESAPEKAGSLQDLFLEGLNSDNSTPEKVLSFLGSVLTGNVDECRLGEVMDVIQKCFWPLVKQMRIGSKWDLLKLFPAPDGPSAPASSAVPQSVEMTIVDIPGFGDENVLREEVSRRCIGGAHRIIMCAEAARAGSDDRARKFLKKDKVQELHMRNIGRDNLILVATKSDQVEVDELRKRYHVDHNTTVSRHPGIDTGDLLALNRDQIRTNYQALVRGLDFRNVPCIVASSAEYLKLLGKIAEIGPSEGQQNCQNPAGNNTHSSSSGSSSSTVNPSAAQQAQQLIITKYKTPDQTEIPALIELLAQSVALEVFEKKKKVLQQLQMASAEVQTQVSNPRESTLSNTEVEKLEKAAKEGIADLCSGTGKKSAKKNAKKNDDVLEEEEDENDMETGTGSARSSLENANANVENVQQDSPSSRQFRQNLTRLETAIRDASVAADKSAQDVARRWGFHLHHRTYWAIGRRRGRHNYDDWPADLFRVFRDKINTAWNDFFLDSRKMIQKCIKEELTDREKKCFDEILNAVPTLNSEVRAQMEERFESMRGQWGQNYDVKESVVIKKLNDLQNSVSDPQEQLSSNFGPQFENAILRHEGKGYLFFRI